MSVIRTTNNPKMLIWAREEIGYTIQQASEATGISEAILIAAEAGEHKLTLNQLRLAAEKYDIPFGYFYFSEPPHKNSFKPVPDFRIEPNFRGNNHYRLEYEIKKCRDNREVFLELAQSLNEEINAFKVIQPKMSGNVGSEVRERLSISDRDISSLTYDDSYNYWKGKIEADGVLVYESQYIPDETGVIGVAIFYEVLPVILIKRGPYFNERKLFTLLHEYAHLLHGKSAINDASSLTIDESVSNETNIEVICNKLAAEILVPSEKVVPDAYTKLELVEKMVLLAKTFKVTYSTAAVCLKRAKLIDYSQLQQLLALRKKEVDKRKTEVRQSPQIPREIINRLDMGRPMFNVVLNAYSTGLLDVFDTSKILNLRVNKIDRLVSRMR
jgi:Zn-dependent peptidase ImmA (M78 family)